MFGLATSPPVFHPPAPPGPDTRTAYPLKGRYLVFTNSPTCEYQDQNKRFSYPLLTGLYTGSPIDGPTGYSFIIEAIGFLMMEHGYHYRIVETDRYQKFHYIPFGNMNAQISAFVPAPKIILK